MDSKICLPIIPKCCGCSSVFVSLFLLFLHLSFCLPSFHPRSFSFSFLVCSSPPFHFLLLPFVSFLYPPSILVCVPLLTQATSSIFSIYQYVFLILYITKSSIKLCLAIPISTMCSVGNCELIAVSPACFFSRYRQT